MKINLEENELNRAQIEVAVVPRIGEHIRVRYSSHGKEPEGTLDWIVQHVAHVADNIGGSRKFETTEARPTSIVLAVRPG